MVDLVKRTDKELLTEYEKRLKDIKFAYENGQGGGSHLYRIACEGLGVLPVGDFEAMNIQHEKALKEIKDMPKTKCKTCKQKREIAQNGLDNAATYAVRTI